MFSLTFYPFLRIWYDGAIAERGEPMNDLIKHKLSTLPTNPGVYLMKDKDGNVIYVGKAINLKNRVRSYFRTLPKEAVKPRALVRHIEDME